MNEIDNNVDRVDIPNYEGIYYCTREGNIFRYAYKKIRKNNGGGGLFKKKQLKCTKSGKYKIVGLCKNSVTKCFRLHVVVALCFHGLRPSGYVIDHIDRNSDNNRADNLRYILQIDNVRNTDRYEKSVGYVYFYGKYRVRSSVGGRVCITKNTESEAQQLVSEIKQGMYSLDQLKKMNHKPQRNINGRYLCHN